MCKERAERFSSCLNLPTRTSSAVLLAMKSYGNDVDGDVTWKKLSSLSLRMPSLSRSDTLKILVKDLMQEGFNCNTEAKVIV